MIFPQNLSAADVLALLHECGFPVDLRGNADTTVRGLNLLALARAGDLVFVDAPRYMRDALQSPADLVLCRASAAELAATNKSLLLTDDPYAAFGRLIERLARRPGAEAIIGAGTAIEPGVHIGTDVAIGRDCVIRANVVIHPGTRIGDRVVIQSGSVVGSDGFYYQRRAAGLLRLPSGGDCAIHDDVEIGAGCTIDRGVTATTTIGTGTKIDNLVHVGHDTVIGAHCLIAGCVGIAGTAVIEDEVTLWGQVGVGSLVTIGRGAEILAKSAVLHDVPPGKRWFGTPARDARRHMKELALLKQMVESNGRVDPA